MERHTRLIAGAPRRRVSFRIHHQVRVPLATGWWRPAVLLPVDWHGWDEATQRYALAHELTHIRRGDYVVQLLSAVNRCLFWFHPLAWMLPERLASLAERACDQEVVERCGDRPRYARVLLRVAASVAAGPPRPAWIGASMLDGDGLSPRIEAVLATPRRRRLPRRWATGVLAGLLIAGVAGAAVLEVEPTPEPPEALAVPAVPTAPRVPAPSVAPVAPVAPLAPRNEAAPTVPVVPSAPVAPSAPTESSAPAAPTAPSAPTAPVLAPSLAPEAPSAPTAPRPGLPAVAPAPPPAPEVRDRPVVVAALPALPASGFDLSAELAGPADDGEPETAASPAVEPCAVARNYILWFDDQGRRPFQGEPLSATPKRWLEDVGRWIRDDLCPADRVAIVSFKGKMRIDQDFTRDREAAVQALDQVTRWKPSRVAAPPAAGEPSLLRALPSKRELRWRSGEIDRALDLLGEIAATVEGRKDLIVLTRGFVEWNEIGARNGTGGYGLRTIYRSQAERIRAAGVVVHAIQTGPGSFYLWGGVSALTHRTGGFIYGTHNYWESRAQSHAVRSRQARDYSVLDGLRAIIRAIELEAS